MTHLERPEPTPAQAHAQNERATGHPPAHEQYPLSEAEQQLVDDAQPPSPKGRFGR